MISTIYKVALPLAAILALSACEMMGMAGSKHSTASDTMMTEESSVSTEAVDAAN